MENRTECCNRRDALQWDGAFRQRLSAASQPHYPEKLPADTRPDEDETRDETWFKNKWGLRSSENSKEGTRGSMIA